MTKDTKLILDAITEMRGDITEMRGDITEMRGDITEMREDITAINLKIENVLEKQIGILRDGHLDLMRKMNDVLEVHQGREMYIARLNKVEIEVDSLKRKMRTGGRPHQHRAGRKEEQA